MKTATEAEGEKRGEKRKEKKEGRRHNGSRNRENERKAGYGTRKEGKKKEDTKEVGKSRHAKVRLEAAWDFRYL